MKIECALLLILLSLLIPSEVHSQTQIHEGMLFEDPILGKYSDLFEYTQILLDSTGTMTYEEIIGNDSKFEENNTKEGYDEDGVYWIKSVIKENTGKDGQYLLSIGINSVVWPSVGFAMATWPFVDIYFQKGDSTRVIKSGFKRDPQLKDVRNAFSYFRLELKANEEISVYARLDPDGGFWSQISRPKYISIYSFDPTSLDFLDGTYRLRNFENDKISFSGYPRHRNLFEVLQILPDSTCQMTLDDVVNVMDTDGLFYLDDLAELGCYWAYTKINMPGILG